MASFNIFSNSFGDLFKNDNVEDQHAKTKDLYMHCNRALWRAVILQSVIDIINNSKRTEYIVAKIDAKKWIFNENEDFLYVCKMAAYQPDYVRKKVLRIMRKNLIAKMKVASKIKKTRRETKFLYFGTQITSGIFRNSRSCKTNLYYKKAYI